MAELSKYDMLISELSGIETRLENLTNKYRATSEMNKELESLLAEAKKENQVLSQKILKLESEIERLESDKESGLLNSLNLKERENLKLKLQNLLNRIEYHISS